MMISLDTTVPLRELYAERLGLTITPAELRVMRLTADGFTQAEIAAALNVCHVTVVKHKASVVAKLNARNATHAVHLLTLRGVLLAQ